MSSLNSSGEMNSDCTASTKAGLKLGGPESHLEKVDMGPSIPSSMPASQAAAWTARPPYRFSSMLPIPFIPPRRRSAGFR